MPPPIRIDPPFTADEQALLAEDVELDPDTRLRILLLHRGLEQSDHYKLLGVARDADRKALKRAYFDLAAKLHPDRYFRKRLGSFKLRMEAVFSRVTLAHDVLSNAERRAEYDAYLEEQRRSRGIEELLADAMAEVRRAEERAEEIARQAPPEPPPPPAPAVTSPAPSSVDVAIAARRDALARRLLGGRRPPPQRISSPPPAPRPADAARQSPSEAMDAIKRRYEERKSLAKATQARAYVEKANQAAAAGDFVGAANAFRVAATLTPEDPSLQRTAKETQAKADALLAETYEKQAIYEERSGQWPEAARSWARVCKVRPDDHAAHERAANAMAKGGADLHEAARLAQRACAMQPDNTAYRMTLANVYVAAGLTLNARRELETAAQLAPQDGTIQAMLKRVGKSA